MWTGFMGEFSGAAPKKFVTRPLSLPENEGNASFNTKYSKNCLKIPCKGSTKDYTPESRTSFITQNYTLKHFRCCYL